MKGVTLILVFLTSFGALAGWRADTRATLREYKAECRNTEVAVDELVRDSHIKGHITGLPTEAYDKFKVVFYVKTNRWYVHPYSYYEGQEEGYSYSNLNANGEFQIKTLRRDVPSKQMAVVLVPRSFKIKSQRWWLRPILGIFGGVLKFQCNHTIVPGNGDFLQ